MVYRLAAPTWAVVGLRDVVRPGKGTAMDMIHNFSIRGTRRAAVEEAPSPTHLDDVGWVDTLKEFDRESRKFGAVRFGTGRFGAGRLGTGRFGTGRFGTGGFATVEG